MASGFGVGGAGRGLARGIEVGTAFNRNTILSRNAKNTLAANEKKAQRDILFKDVQDFNTQIDAMLKSPEPNAIASARRVVEAMKQNNSVGFAAFAKRGRSLGITGLGKRMILRADNALLSAATPEQIGTAAGKEAVGAAQEKVAAIKAVPEAEREGLSSALDIDQPKEPVRLLTADEIKEQGLPEGSVVEFNPNDQTRNVIFKKGETPLGSVSRDIILPILEKVKGGVKFKDLPSSEREAFELAVKTDPFIRLFAALLGREENPELPKSFADMSDEELKKIASGDVSKLSVLEIEELKAELEKRQNK